MKQNNIVYKYDNIFDSDADILINPVNTVGIMGAGLALQFSFRYPAMFEDYNKACKEENCAIGKCHTFYDIDSKRFIINLPTKEHWRNPSKLEYIQKGMNDLVRILRTESILNHIIAIPALGSGLRRTKMVRCFINYTEGNNRIE